MAILDSLLQWIERQPAWLRPPLFGVALIYDVAIRRGGLLLLPVVLIVTAWQQPSAFWKLFLAIFIYAPAGGFVGGLCYYLSSPLARVGAVGRFLQHACASFGYAIVLTFLVVPAFDSAGHGTHVQRTLAVNLGIAGVISFFGALVLTVASVAPPGRQRTSWKFVTTAVGIGAFLVLIMYLAGWTS